MSLDTDHKLTHLGLGRNSIDVNYIVRVSLVGCEVGRERELNMETVGMATNESDRRKWANGELQSRIVDMYHSVGECEMLFVDAGELVCLGVALAMSILGKATLEYDAEEG